MCSESHAGSGPAWGWPQSPAHRYQNPYAGGSQCQFSGSPRVTHYFCRTRAKCRVRMIHSASGPNSPQSQGLDPGPLGPLPEIGSSLSLLVSVSIAFSLLPAPRSNEFHSIDVLMNSDGIRHRKALQVIRVHKLVPNTSWLATSRPGQVIFR